MLLEALSAGYSKYDKYYNADIAKLLSLDWGFTTLTLNRMNNLVPACKETLAEGSLDLDGKFQDVRDQYRQDLPEDLKLRTDGEFYSIPEV